MSWFSSRLKMDFNARFWKSCLGLNFILVCCLIESVMKPLLKLQILCQALKWGPKTSKCCCCSRFSSSLSHSRKLMANQEAKNVVEETGNAWRNFASSNASKIWWNPLRGLECFQTNAAASISKNHVTMSWRVNLSHFASHHLCWKSVKLTRQKQHRHHPAARLVMITGYRIKVTPNFGNQAANELRLAMAVDLHLDDKMSRLVQWWVQLFVLLSNDLWASMIWLLTAQ